MSTFAILHPESLLGKEIRESLSRGEGPAWTEIRLLTTRQDEVGTLTEVGGAAAIVQRYEPGSLAGVDAAFFCGPAAANRPIFAERPEGMTAILLSPDAGPEDGPPVVTGVSSAAARRGEIMVSPHPAAVLLAHLLHALADLTPTEASATLIQPTSLHDEPGIEELFEQSREIIAMTQRRRSKVFGAQIAFNLLPLRQGEATADSVSRTLHTLLPAAPRVTVQILQGGIFHCLSASLRLRFASDPGAATLRRALARSPYLEMAGDPAHLGPIDAAASPKILLGPLHKDAGGGFWLWAVMDNLTRGGALNAIEAAAEAS